MDTVLLVMFLLMAPWVGVVGFVWSERQRVIHHGKREIKMDQVMGRAA